MDEAESICREILSSQPDWGEALHLLGLVLWQSGRKELAVESVGKAARVEPRKWEFQLALGQMLSSLGRREEAIGAYRLVLSEREDLVDAWINLGAALRATGKAAEGAASLEKALKIRADSFEAWFNLGNARAELKLPQAAAEAFARAARLRPTFADAWINLGAAKLQLGELAGAIEAFDRAKEAQPRMVGAWINGGIALRAAKKDQKAVEYFRRALELDPNHAVAIDQLGAAYRRMGEYEASIAAYRRLIALRPDSPKSLLILSSILQDVGKVSESLVACDQYLSECPEDADGASFRLCLLHLHPDYSQEQIFNEHLEWDRRYGGGRAAEHQSPRDPDRRLRIGYVSPDFRLHSVSFFIEELLAHHDAKQFEIYCYSDMAHPDEVTQRIKTLSHHWRDIAGRDVAGVEALIREDGIDILVDLAGHTADNRLLVFARKPAPVQVTYLGYPGTTGLAAMDFRLTDAWCDPVGKTEQFHRERLVRLPKALACYRAWENSPEPMGLPGLGKGQATFGCFTVLRKVGPELLQSWGEILARLPGSRLVLKAEGLGDAAARERIGEALRGMGVSADRVTFQNAESMEKYFAAHGEVDVVLDTFPASGHTVVCHALWMGVPVVSLAGQVYGQRLGSSVLNSLGLREWVANSPREYVEIAVRLGGDLPGLAKLSAGLRDRMRASPLMDGKQFARDVEAAYREMWRGASAPSR